MCLEEPDFFTEELATVFEIPIEMLVDSFVYEEYDGVDRNHAPKYKEAETIENVRIDRKRTYFRDSEEAGIRSEAKIFCYANGTNPFLKFQEQSRVTFDDKEYTVRLVNEFVAPYSNEITAVQLEVI